MVARETVHVLRFKLEVWFRFRVRIRVRVRVEVRAN
jgi:hypothetical protein